MTTTWAIVLIVFVVAVFGTLSIVGLVSMILEAQERHYKFLAEQRENKDVIKLATEFEVKIKEFDDYKKRVDSLTLRAGFKV